MIKNRISYTDFAVAMTCLFLGACSNNAVKEYHESKRDNEIDGTPSWYPLTTIFHLYILLPLP